MSYFRTCPRCGAHLDPGEICECWKEDTPELEMGRKAPVISRKRDARTTGMDEYVMRRWREWDER